MATQIERPEERRATERFEQRIPIMLLAQGRRVSAFTRDLSARGVFFYVPASDNQIIGKELEFVVEFPPSITLCTSLRARCTGKVLRKQTTTAQETGVAAQIYRYDFLPRENTF
jgi:hypothetical protein